MIKGKEFGRNQKMSFVTSTNLKSWLPSFSGFSASADGEQQPLLHSTTQQEPGPESFVSKRKIEDIVLMVFYDVFTYRFVPINTSGSEGSGSKVKLVTYNEAEAMKLSGEKIDAALMEIVAILRLQTEADAKLIDHAVWALMMAATFRMGAKHASPYARSCKDITAAYVMKTLLFPLKCGTAMYDGENQLYKLQRHNRVRGFDLGPAVLAAIASRPASRASAR